MWLINCSDYALKEFLEEPKTYAILSHTWGNAEDEVSFQQMTCLDIAKKLTGFSKIEMCCQTASKQEIEWAWVDTCCIDKTSSSALQEAINSMFRWYQNATVCYAYLSDVPGALSQSEREECFRESRWFSRGWTLQELIAPQKVWFYDQTWTKCGTKISQKRLISEITGIEQKVLEGSATVLSEYSVAQKMCWASRRTTTRQEDMAYCLLGIFDINMPLIYGEGGQRAFIRLQEQIMQDSDDQSIFAWESGPKTRAIGTGLLADSPALFRKSGQIIALRNWHQGEPFQMTNRGLRLYLPLLDSRDDQESNEQLFQGALACQYKQHSGTVLGILLGRILDSGDQYLRKGGRLCHIPAEELQLRTSQSIGSFRSLSEVKESQNMYRWIYVRKAIQFPKKEEVESPGDLVAFRIAFSEETDPTWTVSSYPNEIKDTLPVEITPPQPAEFRWNPAVWSWHAVLVFTKKSNSIPSSKNPKEKFFLAIGWNGASRKTWRDLGTTLATAKEIHERYTLVYPKQRHNSVRLKHADGYQRVDHEVKISHLKMGPTDGGIEIHKVGLKIETNRSGP